jgi:hypothetical protein
MIRGPQIPWKTRLGMIGETQVKTRLAYFSIPTKYEIDPGIDFYCELLENDSPSLPFYIQAKGTEHFDDNGGQSIRKSTLMKHTVLKRQTAFAAPALSHVQCSGHPPMGSPVERGYTGPPKPANQLSSGRDRGTQPFHLKASSL